MEYILNAANDLGYGSIKATLNDEKVKMPSVIAGKKPQDITEPVSFDDQEKQTAYMKDFLNKMDVSVSSSAVTKQGRYLIGQAAVNSNLPLTAFDVNDFAGKSDDDLAMVLTLSLIAGKRVKDAFFNSEDLGETLKVTINMATALPVAEGKNTGVIDRYKNKFLGKTHTVTFHNFKDPITVAIKFRTVYVALEGETAQLFIKNSDEKFKAAMVADLKANYPELADVSANDIVQTQNVLGIDIGEGTTDLVMLVNNLVNAKASTSLAKGYGNVLQLANDALQKQQMGFDNRAQLQSYLAQHVSPFARKHQQRIQSIVYEQLEPFADEIVTAVSKTMRLANARAELIYVYGGGSIPMATQSSLRTKLADKLRHFTGGDEVPIIWIAPEYAQFLNEKGLELILSAIAE